MNMTNSNKTASVISKIIYLLIAIEAILIFLWILSPEKNWEPWATGINAILIPLLYIVKSKTENASIITNNESNTPKKESIDDAKLEVRLKSVSVKSTGDPSSYMAQINLWIISHFRDSTIHSIHLRKLGNPFDSGVKGPYRPEGLEINSLYPESGDLLNLDLGDFIKKVDSIKKSQSLTDFTISANKINKYSIYLLISSERYSDGYEPFIIKDWELGFDYNLDKVLQEKFDFKIHPSNPKVPTAYREDGFS